MMNLSLNGFDIFNSGLTVVNHTNNYNKKFQNFMHRKLTLSKKIRASFPRLKKTSFRMHSISLEFRLKLRPKFIWQKSNITHLGRKIT